MVGLLVLVPSARKESNRIDFGGAVLLALSVVSLIFALTELGRTDGDPNPFLVGGGVLLAIVGTYALLRYENIAPSPILEIKLLKRKEFAYLNTLNFFYGVSIFGVFSFIPLYAQNAYGMSSSETGYLLTPRAIVMIIFSTVASIILPRTGYRKPIIIGLLVLVVGMIFLAAEPHAFDLGGIHFSDFVVLAAVVSIAGVGLGIAGPAANNAAIELEPERVAAITGMRGMFRSLGGAIGVSVIVLITAYTARRRTGHRGRLYRARRAHRADNPAHLRHPGRSGRHAAARPAALCTPGDRAEHLSIRATRHAVRGCAVRHPEAYDLSVAPVSFCSRVSNPCNTFAASASVSVRSAA